jgi:hypothetical protein
MERTISQSKEEGRDVICIRRRTISMYLPSPPFTFSMPTLEGSAWARSRSALLDASSCGRKACILPRTVKRNCDVSIGVVERGIVEATDVQNSVQTPVLFDRQSRCWVGQRWEEKKLKMGSSSLSYSCVPVEILRERTTMFSGISDETGDERAVRFSRKSVKDKRYRSDRVHRRHNYKGIRSSVVV